MPQLIRRGTTAFLLSASKIGILSAAKQLQGQSAPQGFTTRHTNNQPATGGDCSSAGPLALLHAARVPAQQYERHRAQAARRTCCCCSKALFKERSQVPTRQMLPGASFLSCVSLSSPVQYILSAYHRANAHLNNSLESWTCLLQAATGAWGVLQEAGPSFHYTWSPPRLQCL